MSETQKYDFDISSTKGVLQATKTVVLPVKLGSDKICKIRVQSKTIKPVHATVEERKGSIVIIPEDEDAQTTVNDTAVTKSVVLKKGDVILLGNPTSSLRLCFKGPSEEPKDTSESDSGAKPEKQDTKRKDEKEGSTAKNIKKEVKEETSDDKDEDKEDKEDKKAKNKDKEEEDKDEDKDEDKNEDKEEDKEEEKEDKEDKEESQEDDKEKEKEKKTVEKSKKSAPRRGGQNGRYNQRNGRKQYVPKAKKTETKENSPPESPESSPETKPKRKNSPVKNTRAKKGGKKQTSKSKDADLISEVTVAKDGYKMVGNHVLPWRADPELLLGAPRSTRSGKALDKPEEPVRRRTRQGKNSKPNPPPKSRPKPESPASPEPKEKSPSPENSPNDKEKKGSPFRSKSEEMRLNSAPSPNVDVKIKVRMSNADKVLTALEMIGEPRSKRDITLYLRRHFGNIADKEVTEILQVLIEDGEITTSMEGNSTRYALAGNQAETEASEPDETQTPAKGDGPAELPALEC